jgi:hypothetical protein
MNKATPEQLRTAVLEMDNMAQNAFEAIASLAELALLALEQPSTYRNGLTMESIADVPNTIRGKAQTTVNDINSAAEEVGCSYVDKARRKRWDAIEKARESAIGGRV